MQDTQVLGKFLRDVGSLNKPQSNFRIFGPDETMSNLLAQYLKLVIGNGMLDKTQMMSFFRHAGSVLDSMLSEHQCEGWLEGYLLTGRHGVFNCYEAFIRIIDSMFSQHAKWLKVTLATAVAKKNCFFEFTSWLPMYGSRITMVSPIKILVSLIM